jgi:hypothetical protein
MAVETRKPTVGVGGVDRDVDPAVAQMFDPSLVLPNPATDLLPGEARLDTIPDDFYGEVESGAPPRAYLAVQPEVDLDAVQAAVEEGRVWLDGEKQTRIEVLTGKRLQARAAQPRSKEEQDRIKKGREEREKEAKIKAKAEDDEREEREKAAEKEKAAGGRK